MYFIYKLQCKYELHERFTLGVNLSINFSYTYSPEYIQASASYHDRVDEILKKDAKNCAMIKKSVSLVSVIQLRVTIWRHVHIANTKNNLPN